MMSDKRATFIMGGVVAGMFILFVVHQVLLALSSYNAHLDKNQLYADLIVPFVVPIGIFGGAFFLYYLIQESINYHTRKTIIAEDVIDDVEDLKDILLQHRKILERFKTHNHKD